jgi:hydroxyethylthiazole kinase-like uncharacterized protein yjeF
MQLPQPSAEGDKMERGSVLVVAGAVELPGAAVLAGTAALRAGAGRLRIATCASVAAQIGVAVPECFAIRLPETDEGGVSQEAAPIILKRASEVHALVIGPGMHDVPAMDDLFGAVLPRLECAAAVLDACAVTAVGRDKTLLRDIRFRAVLTPHAGEMAKLTGLSKEEVRARPLAVAREAARALDAVVMLKGPETFVVPPEGDAFCYGGGNVGLATSGSGDTLAGVVGGLLARGADPVTAGAWAAWLHGEAGNRLQRRHGLVGFLARELLDEIPGLMGELSG